jgi:GT2 family glycosyltransferase
MSSFLFSATKGKKEDTLLYQNRKATFFFKEDNTDALAVVYNKAIDFAIQENVDYLVLCHDDAIIESADFEERLIKLHKQYDVLGVAGTTECKLQAPALWHILGSGRETFNNLRGAVAHGDANLKQMTSFGEYPARVLLLDGVFLSIKKEVFTKIRFDESCPAKFHFYDLNYSLECNKAKFKLGVSDILITHKSPGLAVLTPEFNEGQEWFLNKWRPKTEKNKD